MNLSKLKLKLQPFARKVEASAKQFARNTEEYFSWDPEFIRLLRIRGANACESPIEEKFYWALINEKISLGIYGSATPMPLYQKRDKATVIKKTQKNLRYVFVYPQEWFERKYRLDFLIAYGTIGRQRKLVVECDGRTYHDNGDSFQKDRERDRVLNASGIRVLRFTGNEINMDVKKCVAEVIRVIQQTL
jgi:very-short-patch-repair endonuclease